MKKIIVLLLMISGAAGYFHASAQRDNRLHEQHVVSVVVNENEASPDDVEKTFKENGPETPNDNALPRFAIVGKHNKFYMGLGAQFLGEAVFDWGADMPSPLFMVPSAMTPASVGNRSNLGFGWQSSSVYMNIVALPHTGDQIGLFFKMNFTGSNNSVSVYHLYARYRGLTVGYNTGIFTDGAAMPFTIDFQGPAGYPYLTLFNASWTQKFTGHLTGAIGIDAPQSSATYGNGAEEVNQRIPAIPMYLQYGWNDGAAHVRLSGIVRPMQYRDDVVGKNKILLGGGVQLSGMTPIAGGLTAQFNAVYGKGIGTYIQDDKGQGIDAIACAVLGKMEMTGTLGLTGAVIYSFSPKVSANLVYSHVSNWFGRDGAIVSGTYRYGDYAAANVVYAINKFLSAGLEYDYAHRKNIAGESLHTNRLQCQLAITF